MKRIFFITSILFSAAVVQAQMALGFGAMNGMQPGFRNFTQRIDTSHLQKKWFLTKYAGISAGLGSFNGGGSSSFLSAPMGIQLNRSLSNNVLAFAGVSVAPSYFPGVGFNMPFQSDINKNNGFMTPHRFGTYSTAQMGLMYINNERTFSISGSIGVGRSDYYGRFPTFTPGHPPAIRNSKQ